MHRIWPFVIVILHNSDKGTERIARVANNALFPLYVDVQLYVVAPGPVSLPFWRHGRYRTVPTRAQVRTRSKDVIFVRDTADISPFLFYWFWRVRRRVGPRVAIACNRGLAAFSPGKHTVVFSDAENASLCKDATESLVYRPAPPWIVRVWDERFVKEPFIQQAQYIKIPECQ